MAKAERQAGALTRRRPVLGHALGQVWANAKRPLVQSYASARTILGEHTMLLKKRSKVIIASPLKMAQIELGSSRAWADWICASMGLILAESGPTLVDIGPNWVVFPGQA